MSLGMLSLPKVADLDGIYINFEKFDGDLTNIKYQDEKLE